MKHGHFWRPTRLEPWSSPLYSGYPLMTYDWTVKAIGPFELSEYIALVATYTSLAMTAPFLARRS